MQIAAYGIPDDAASNQQNTIFGVTLDNHATSRWHNQLSYGGVRLRSEYNDWAPTGIPYDPYGLGYPSYYLGAPVTQQGANGYTITPAAVAAIEPGLAYPGQAIFQYAGNYPELSSYLTNTNTVYAQTDYRVNEKLTALFGFRYTNESGFTYNPFEGLENYRPQQFQLPDGNPGRAMEPAVLHLGRRHRRQRRIRRGRRHRAPRWPIIWCAPATATSSAEPG